MANVECVRLNEGPVLCGRGSKAVKAATYAEKKMNSTSILAEFVASEWEGTIQWKARMSSSKAAAVGQLSQAPTDRTFPIQPTCC